MNTKAPPEWQISNESDAVRTQAILTACRIGSQARFASLYASTRADSLPPLCYCLYVATTVSRWSPLVSYILTLDPAPPQGWPYAQLNNERARRGLSSVLMYDYVYHAIFSAVAKGDTLVVQAFLDAGLEQDTVLEYSYDRIDSLLELAVRADLPDMVRYLLARGANPLREVLDGGPFTIIALAATTNKPGLLRLLISDERRDKQFKRSWAMWNAAFCCAIDAAETLLDLGADVNDVFNVDPDGEKEYGHNGAGTALHNAVLERQPKFAHWLLQKGADLDIKDGSGQTARDIATKQGYSEMQEMFEAWESNRGNETIP